MLLKATIMNIEAYPGDTDSRVNVELKIRQILFEHHAEGRNQ